MDQINHPFTSMETEHKLHALFCQCETVDPADVEAVATTVKRALNVYGTPAFVEMINNCMALDLSWKVSNFP